MATYDKLITVFYLFVLFIAFFIGVYYKVYKNKRFFYLVILLFVTFLVEFVSHYSLLVFGKTIGGIFAFFLPVQYILLSFYFRSIIRNKILKKSISASIPIVLCWNTCNVILFQNLRMFNTYSILLVCLLYCSWSIFYFIELLQDVTEEGLSHNSDFWICTGTLFFYSTSFFIIGFIQIISKENRDIAVMIWSLIRLFNIILYSLYAYGLICQIRYQNTHI